MTSYLFLPLMFLKFWFFEAPKEIILYFISLNIAFLDQFSVPLLLKTYFKPIKNEYRQGLIWFSIGMGMFIKFWFILIGLSLFLVLLAGELIILAGFIAWPVVTIMLLAK